TDTDHATAWPDGDTVIGNLIPTDRTWHRGKTRNHLSVTVDDTGAVTWTSVLGQSRTVTPHDYRATNQDTDQTAVTERDTAATDVTKHDTPQPRVTEATVEDDPPPF